MLLQCMTLHKIMVTTDILEIVLIVYFTLYSCSLFGQIHNFEQVPSESNSNLIFLFQQFETPYGNMFL